MSSDPLSILTDGLFDGQTLGVATSGLLQATLHERTEVRRHVAALLVEATQASDRVFVTRTLPVNGEDLAGIGPVLLIFTTNDQAGDPINGAPPLYRFFLDLVVQIVAVSALPDLQETFDAIELVVRTILLADDTLGGHAAVIEPAGSVLEVFEQAEWDLASQTVTFRVEYHVDASDLPDGDLRTVIAGWNLAPPDGTLEAQDQLDLDGGIP